MRCLFRICQRATITITARSGTAFSRVGGVGWRVRVYPNIQANTCMLGCREPNSDRENETRMLPPYISLPKKVTETPKPPSTPGSSGTRSNHFLDINGVAPSAPTPPPAPKPPAPRSSGGGNGNTTTSPQFLEANGVSPHPAPSPAPAPTPVNTGSGQANITTSRQFLEANGVNPPPATPPAPTVSANSGSPSTNNYFLDINGVATDTPAATPQPFSSNSSLSYNRFLEINGVYPEPVDPPAPQTQVEAAVVQLEEAIDTRDAVPPHLQGYYQGQVNAARDNLEHAIHDEIESIPLPPYSYDPDAVTLQQKIDTGNAIAAEYTNEPIIGDEVQRAVDSVIADYEVEDTLETLEDAGSSQQALGILDDVYADLSPTAQDRIRSEQRVQEIFDDIATDATQPLHEPSTDFNLMSDVLISADNLDQALSDIDNPDLAAEVVTRTLPAFDNAIALQHERDDSFGIYDGLMFDETLNILGSVSDRIIGADNERVAMDGLTRLALQSGPGIKADYAGIPDTSDGSGIALATSIIKSLETDPDPDFPDLAVRATDKLIEDYGQYIEGPVAESIEEYAEHTEELNFYISAFPTDLPPEQLQSAIEEYVENKGPEWQAELTRLEANVADHGVNLLRGSEMISEVTHVTDDGAEKLTDVASQDNFVNAVSIASGSHPERLAEIDIDAALTFVSTLKLGNKTIGLGRRLANAHVQGVVAQAIGDVSPTDPASIAAARSAINSLRSEQFAEVWEIDGGLAELDKAVEALEGTLPDGGVIDVDEISTRFSEYEDELSGLKAFEANQPLGFAFRSLGLASSVQGAISSTSAFFDDPSLESGIKAAVADISFAQQATQFATELGIVADDSALALRFGSNATVGKLLGVAGIALGTVGVVRDLQDRDFLQAGLGAAGIGGGALALFGSASWAGPVGVAIGVLAAAGSLGVDQFRTVAESNKYTGEEARAFFRHAGFDPVAARALADRSGEGYSPVPALLHYGKLNGLSTEETIDWINSIDKEELDRARDFFHHQLDHTDGSLEDFDAEDAQTTNIVFERLGIPLP